MFTTLELVLMFALAVVLLAYFNASRQALLWHQDLVFLINCIKLLQEGRVYLEPSPDGKGLRFRAIDRKI